MLAGQYDDCDAHVHVVHYLLGGATAVAARISSDDDDDDDGDAVFIRSRPLMRRAASVVDVAAASPVATRRRPAALPTWWQHCVGCGCAACGDPAVEAVARDCLSVQADACLARGMPHDAGRLLRALVSRTDAGTGAGAPGSHRGGLVAALAGLAAVGLAVGDRAGALRATARALPLCDSRAHPSMCEAHATRSRLWYLQAVASGMAADNVTDDDDDDGDDHLSQLCARIGRVALGSAAGHQADAAICKTPVRRPKTGAATCAGPRVAAVKTQRAGKPRSVRTRRVQPGSRGVSQGEPGSCGVSQGDAGSCGVSQTDPESCGDGHNKVTVDVFAFDSPLDVGRRRPATGRRRRKPTVDTLPGAVPHRAARGRLTRAQTRTVEASRAVSEDDRADCELSVSGTPLTPLEEATEPATLDSSLLSVGTDDSLAQVDAFSPARVDALSPARVDALSPAQVDALSPTRVDTLSPARVDALSPAQVDALSPARGNALSPAQVDALSPARVDALSPTRVDALSPARVDALSPAQVDALSPARGNALSPAQVDALSPAQVDALSPARVDTLSPARGDALSPAQVDAWSPAQVDALSPARVDTLSPAQVDALSPTRVDALSPAQVDALSPTRVDALSPAQVGIELCRAGSDSDSQFDSPVRCPTTRRRQGSGGRGRGVGRVRGRGGKGRGVNGGKGRAAKGREKEVERRTSTAAQQTTVGGRTTTRRTASGELPDGKVPPGWDGHSTPRWDGHSLPD